MTITGPKYWLAGRVEDSWWQTLCFGWTSTGSVTETGQPDVQTWDDEEEFLPALRQALARSDHCDRDVLACPYESTIVAVLRQRMGRPQTPEEYELAHAYDYERMD